MIDCSISKNYQTFNIGTIGYSLYVSNPFYATIIKIYIFFNVASNLLNNNGYGLLMGLISNDNANVGIGTTYQMNEFYYNGLESAKLVGDNKIKYCLKDIPNGIININITGYNNGTGTPVPYTENYLLDRNPSTGATNPPSNVLLCLKFTYEF